MEELLVVKIGGNVIDNDTALDAFLRDFSSIEQPKILIHGGGKLATELSSQLGLETKMVEGRRITDSDTVKVVTMTYAGWVNKTIVAKLQAKGCTAMGLSGADARLLPAEKRPATTVDYGWVGNLDAAKVNTGFLKTLLALGMVPVVAPIACNSQGQLLNVNADTVASTIAEAMAHQYQTTLIYCFEKNGLLQDVNDDASVIDLITTANAEQLKATGIISAGMVPKVDNALGAVKNGVYKVVIGNAAHIAHIAAGHAGFGTQIKAR